MEYPWRPRASSTSNFCPVCSNPHFPFCPPPPHPQYFRPPPPPPDQLFHPPQPPPPPPPPPSYDPFLDHQGVSTINPYPPPQPGQIPPRPWNGNPSFSNHGNPVPVFDYDNNCQVGAKRMRFNNANEGYASSGMAEEERRLKLIRDHGAMNLGFGRSSNGGYLPSNHSHEINSHREQSYGERQFVHQHAVNNTNSELGRSLHNQIDNNHGYGNFKQAGNHEILGYNATQKHTVEPKSAYYGLPNQDPQRFNVQPPLPTSPPPPLPVEPPRFRFAESFVPSLFPVAVDSSSSFQSPNKMFSEAISSVPTHFTSKANGYSSGYYREETEAVKMASSKTFNGVSEELPPRHLSFDKPKVIDASHILKHPHRANRPDHIVVILRGLPGSGKSYLAKILRDIEIENGGTAPRIHSMDEYFMTEVEESESSRSSGSVRGKKPLMKKVMEYCYEPEMEEAYRSSMLKAFKKTLDEGAFPFVIVDDRNLRVEDFAQFWAIAKRSGYEVYLLEATYKDPAGCAARNVHGFTQNDIHKMANRWEEAPSLYMKLDAKSLLHGDRLEENGIQEVDMDTEDTNCISDPSRSEDTTIEKFSRPFEGYTASDSGSLVTKIQGQSINEEKGDAEEEHPVEMVKELGKSKWSNDLDEDDVHKSKETKGKSIAFSSLIKSYGKKGKSVRWADQVCYYLFSLRSVEYITLTFSEVPLYQYNTENYLLPRMEI
ncbi:hypothetical protein ABFS83_09G033000 [Erythranthe nasuta]